MNELLIIDRNFSNLKELHFFSLENVKSSESCMYCNLIKCYPLPAGLYIYNSKSIYVGPIPLEYQYEHVKWVAVNIPTGDRDVYCDFILYLFIIRS